MKGRERIGKVQETPLVVVLPGGGPATPQILAHELQSPVKAVRLLAESVRSAAGQIGPEQLERCMDSILRSTAYMADVIGRMIGGAEFRLEATDLAGLVRETVEDLGAILGGHPVILRLHPVEEVPVDRTAVREIVVNLLSNAARYAEPRTAICVELYRSSGGVSLSVSDRCGGIPETVRDHVFEPFVRGHPGGTGLGLSLSRSIARAHGGDLIVEGPTPGTCRFTMTVPAAVRVA
jgi:two-component system NtrC family sensor kinase